MRDGAAEAACLVLGDVCKRLLRMPAPPDVSAAEHADAYFAEERARGLEFGSEFRYPLDVRGKVVLDIGCGFGGMMAAMAERGAARVVGVDNHPGHAEYARRATGAEVHTASAEKIPIPAATVDVVVSDAVLEHIHDLHDAMSELHRVLVPGGRVFAVWGPSWLTWNGPHLAKSVGIPWAHLVFSDRTLVNVLERLRDRYPDSYIDEKIADFQQMGRNTRRKLRRAADAAGLRILQEESWSPHRWKRAAARIPLLDELLAGRLLAVLERP